MVLVVSVFWVLLYMPVGTGKHILLALASCRRHRPDHQRITSFRRVVRLACLCIVFRHTGFWHVLDSMDTEIHMANYCSIIHSGLGNRGLCSYTLPGLDDSGRHAVAALSRGMVVYATRAMELELSPSRLVAMYRNSLLFADVLMVEPYGRCRICHHFYYLSRQACGDWWIHGPLVPGPRTLWTGPDVPYHRHVGPQ